MPPPVWSPSPTARCSTTRRATSHNITVQASDGTLTSSQTFTIAVSDVAPATPTDSNGATGDSVAEGAANGTAVGITATAADVNGGTVTYSLTDDAGGRFAINATTGVVTVADGSLLDYETATSHNITVQASDGSARRQLQTFTIAVSDVASPADPDRQRRRDRRQRRRGRGQRHRGRDHGASDADRQRRHRHLQPDRRCRRPLCDQRQHGVVTVADGSLLDYETRDQPQHHRPGLRRHG